MLSLKRFRRRVPVAGWFASGPGLTGVSRRGQDVTGGSRRGSGEKRPAGRYSKVIVAIVITLNALFAAAFLLAFVLVHAEPVGLIVAWFGFSTGELFLLAFLRHEENELLSAALKSDKLDIKFKGDKVDVYEGTDRDRGGGGRGAYERAADGFCDPMDQEQD